MPSTVEIPVSFETQLLAHSWALVEKGIFDCGHQVSTLCCREEGGTLREILDHYMTKEEETLKNLNISPLRKLSPET